MGKYLSAALVAMLVASNAIAQFDSAHRWPSADFPYDGSIMASGTVSALRERCAAINYDPDFENVMEINDYLDDLIYYVVELGYEPDEWMSFLVGNTESFDGLDYTAYLHHYYQYTLLLDVKGTLLSLIPEYVDITKTNASELSFSDYLNENSGALPMWTVSNLIDHIGAPTNYLTLTSPYEMNAASNGWKWMPSIFSNLVCTPFEPTWTNSEGTGVASYTNTYTPTFTGQHVNVSVTSAWDTITPPWLNGPGGISDWYPDPSDCPWSDLDPESCFDLCPSDGWGETGTVDNARPYFSVAFDINIDFDAEAQYVNELGCGVAPFEPISNWNVNAYITNMNDTIVHDLHTNISSQAKAVSEYIEPESMTQWYAKTIQALTSITENTWFLLDESDWTMDEIRLSRRFDYRDEADVWGTSNCLDDFTCTSNESLIQCSGYYTNIVTNCVTSGYFTNLCATNTYEREEMCCPSGAYTNVTWYSTNCFDVYVNTNGPAPWPYYEWHTNFYDDPFGCTNTMEILTNYCSTGILVYTYITATNWQTNTYCVDVVTTNIVGPGYGTNEYIYTGGVNLNAGSLGANRAIQDETGVHWWNGTNGFVW